MVGLLATPRLGLHVGVGNCLLFLLSSFVFCPPALVLKCLC